MKSKGWGVLLFLPAAVPSRFPRLRSHPGPEVSSPGVPGWGAFGRQRGRRSPPWYEKAYARDKRQKKKEGKKTETTKNQENDKKWTPTKNSMEKQYQHQILAAALIRTAVMLEHEDSMETVTSISTAVELRWYVSAYITGILLVLFSTTNLYALLLCTYCVGLLYYVLVLSHTCCWPTLYYGFVLLLHQLLLLRYFHALPRNCCWSTVSPLLLTCTIGELL